MKKKLTLLLTIFLLVSGCSGHTNEQPFKQMDVTAKPLPPKNFLPKDLTIVSIGDSLTQGVGDSTKSGGYIPYLKRSLETLNGIQMVTFHNYGVRGDRTDQLQIRLKQVNMRKAIKKADIVMITIGGNDVMKVFRENLTSLKVDKFQVATNGYRNRLNEIIRVIREYKPDAGIVLIGIYNPFMKWFSDIKELDDIILNWNNESAQALSHYHNTEFIPIYDIFESQDKNLFYSDNFHPNDRGYKLIAKRIFVYLNKKQLSQLSK
jgi:lysophospholipase L1-like esterase